MNDRVGYICRNSTMRCRPTYRLIFLLLLFLLALAFVGVVWYYHGRLEKINREIHELDETYN